MYRRFTTDPTDDSVIIEDIFDDEDNHIDTKYHDARKFERKHRRRRRSLFKEAVVFGFGAAVGSFIGEVAGHLWA